MAEGGEDVAADAVAHREVIVVQDRAKLPKLSGKPKKMDDPDIEEWCEDVSQHIDAKRMHGAQALELVMSLLQGSAKAEVRYRPQQQRQTAQQVLQIIKDVFGESLSLCVLQENFYQRSQKPQETLHEYSVELMKLFDRIVRKDANMEASRNNMQKGKFTEGVLNIHLRRELRRLQRDNPDLEFYEFRERAVNWLGSEISNKSAELNSTVADRTPNETENFMKLLMKQQEQINSLTEMISKLSASKGSKKNKECYTCGKLGHFSRNCRSKQTPEVAKKDSEVQKKDSDRDLNM